MRERGCGAMWECDAMEARATVRSK
jgi:hypothetical protein